MINTDSPVEDQLSSLEKQVFSIQKNILLNYKSDSNVTLEGPFVKYTIYGLTGCSIAENKKALIHNPYVKSMLVSDDFSYLIFELQEGISYKNDKIFIDALAQKTLFNILSQTEIEFFAPSIGLELYKENANLRINEAVKLCESISIHRSIGAESIYKSITSTHSGFDKYPVQYYKIMSILQNPNTIIQFLSLYQILLEETEKLNKQNNFVGPNGTPFKGQRNVIEYFKHHISKYPFIKFRQSRDYDRPEDSITYLRNEIGHCEDFNDLSSYQRLGSTIKYSTIKNLLKVLSDVLDELK